MAQTLRRLVGQSDLLLAAGVVAVVAMLVIPVPPGLLSVLLAANLAISLLVLLVGMYDTQPLEFSAFPSLLLLTTLFRLALNVSSTRLILLYGDAGAVIQAFGQFVAGGNPLVGFIVFLILVIIQFLVITRGAERVAEVAARFTLDAMPGKQMAIDADLNSGLIDQKEARRRRQQIQREADFYGAMDGASKFVRGDAIAGLVILAINIVGGLAMGMLVRHLAWADALRQYTILTIGDGLASQLPALLISTATGIVVTRAAGESDLGHDVLRQVAAQPRALWVAAGTLAVLGLVPGLPAAPFLALAAVTGGVAYLQARQARLRPGEGEAAPVQATLGVTPEEAARLLPVDPLEVELGYGLLPLGAEEGGQLMDRIALLRRQIALELGLVLPLVRVRDNLSLEPNRYRILLKGEVVGEAELRLDRLLAIPQGTEVAGVEGEPTRDPAFNLPALWIRPEQRALAEASGYTVVEAAAVLATHLTEVVRAHAWELLTRQETRRLLDTLHQSAAALVEESVPALLTLGEVQRVLQNLLREGVPIRDLGTVLEALADQAAASKALDELTEAARQALGRSITQRLVGPDGRLRVITLEPAAERQLAESIRGQGNARTLVLEPELAGRLIRGLEAEVARVLEQGVQPVLLCAPGLRFHLRRLLERSLPRLPVLSYNEVSDGVPVDVLGTVRLA
ncbi:MAG: flagellar biosynthesis protein FlhA [Firmicutes bacterium]|nr:flagellar biosynthesis protein FlhA [Bacillota bacterium]